MTQTLETSWWLQVILCVSNKPSMQSWQTNKQTVTKFISDHRSSIFLNIHKNICRWWRLCRMYYFFFHYTLIYFSSFLSFFTSNVTSKTLQEKQLDDVYRFFLTDIFKPPAVCCTMVTSGSTFYRKLMKHLWCG